MIDKARKIECLNGMQSWYTEEQFEMRVRLLAENRKKCSCYMCGNPRKYWKEKTFQEQKFDYGEE